MRLKTKIKTPPTGLPITVAELRGQLRLGDDTTFDTELSRYIQSATNWALRSTGRIFMDTTLEGFVHVLTGDPLEITAGPVKSIEKIEYWDENQETIQTLDPEFYQLDNTGLTACIYFTEDFEEPTLKDRWDAVKVTFISGFGGVADVPSEIKDALIMKAARLYTHPDDGVNERNTISDSILSPFQVPIV